MKMFSLLVLSSIASLSAATPTAGLALSGGGLPAFLTSTCWLHALDIPNRFKNIYVSGVSGGTVGYDLWAQAGTRLLFPPSGTIPDIANLSYEQLSTRLTGAPGTLWFADVTRIASDIAENVASKKHTKTTSDDVPGQWWINTLKDAAWVYSANFSQVPPPLPYFLASFTALKWDVCPIERTSSGGLPNAESILDLVVYDSTNGNFDAPNSGLSGLSVEQVYAASTAFWGAGIATIPVAWPLEHENLLVGYGNGGAKYALMDGGSADSTGIVALLRRKVARIVAIFEDLTFLADAAAPIAYLFGAQNVSVSLITDLEGPTLTQVFPTELYPRVFAALTNNDAPTGPMIRLSNVTVLGNPFLRVSPYVLEELVIFGNQRAEAFLNLFNDPAVKANVGASFPAEYKLDVPIFDANLICAYASWRSIVNDALLQYMLG